MILTYLLSRRDFSPIKLRSALHRSYKYVLRAIKRIFADLNSVLFDFINVFVSSITATHI